MKKGFALLLLVCVSGYIVHAQTANYDRRWLTVDSLMNKKGLTVSALQEVNSIYQLAHKEKNEGQLLKALIYRVRLEQKISDAGLPAAIKELKRQVDSSNGAARSILENMLAGLYVNYLRSNGWRISSRTQPIQENDSDITTFSTEELTRRIITLYRHSLEPEQLLTHIDLRVYQPIIIKGQASWLRPTLWDLLAHRALDYFKTSVGYQRNPVHAFVLEDTVLYSDARTFSQHHVTTIDTLSGHFIALGLFQRSIRLHLADSKPDALIAADIERLNFIHANFIGQRDDLYMQALGRITEAYPTSPQSAEAWYLQANQEYRHGASNPEPIDTNGFVKAQAICEKVLAAPDSSEGKADCKRLLHLLRQKSFMLQMEKVVIPNRPFPALVSWRNFDRLFVRIIRFNDDSAAALLKSSVFDSIQLERLMARPVYRSLMLDLPDTKDLRPHSTEVAIGSLPPGAYALLGTSDSTWSGKRGILGLHNFVVSSISYINQGDNYFVLNRETGKPIAGAKVELVRSSPVHRRGNSVKVLDTFTTDADGHFVLQSNLYSSRGGSNSLEISIPGDHLWSVQAGFRPLQSEDTAVLTDRTTYEENNAHCFLFSDRSIYRPGQTIYFKGITVTDDFDTHRSKPFPGHAATVTLYDVNHQIVDTMRLTTNGFGSFQGSFKLPENRLNGSYELYEPGGSSLSFSVEEYKRPRFYIEYDKQQGSYRAGDSIRITGMAKGYAGNGIDGARVSYRVLRKTRFIYSWMFWRTRIPYGPDQEITSGTITTDATGKFSFVFYGAPDPHVDRANDPQFDFQVSADVTDIDGETRTKATDVVAGYTALKLFLAPTAVEPFPADSFRSLQIGANNLAGAPVPADVRVSIYPLQAPQRLIRERLWPAPDRYILSEKQWLDSFPHDEYRDETRKETWPRGEKVWDITRHVTGTDTLKIDKAFTPGWYVIEATTTDSYGQEVKNLMYVDLFDDKTGRPANPQYIWETGNVRSAEPGEKTMTVTGTSAQDVYLIRCIQRNLPGRPIGKNSFINRNGSGVSSQFSHYTLNEGRKETEWTITENDRGGFGVADAFIKDNRLYMQPSNVPVPWTNKELEIRYASFRDKTEPGSAEKWQMTISGHHGEKVSAEVLTTLYDASLDQFNPHSWQLPDLYPSFAFSQPWSAVYDFGFGASQEKSFEPIRYRQAYQPYDELLQPLEEGRLMRYGGAAAGGVVTYSAIAPAPELAMVRIRGNYSQDQLGDVRLGMEAKQKFAVAATDEPVPTEGPEPMVQPRTNFRETAFFFPDLRTDSTGSVSFSFSMPDALTTWKWMTLASTRDLAFGYSERSVITQKKLMVEPNAPRFLREGDKMELQVKVINLTDSELTGQMALQLTDPTTGQTADGWFVNRQPNQYFTVGAKQSFVVGFPLDIPFQYNRPLTYRVVAQAGNYSDGEEATLPVVSNRLLVTESLPLNLAGDGTRRYTFDKLLKSGSSETLNNHSLTVEFTANPAWYAVQSLPYLVEYPYECAEQTFERFYANALASRISTSTPRLQQVFSSWAQADTTQLLSNLQKNQELKSVLLEETPWVLQGKTEAEQKKNVALLFDMKLMGDKLSAALSQLAAMQSAEGGFPWFKGGPDDTYITQYILTGIGHLQKLQALPAGSDTMVQEIVSAALPYLDEQLKKDYELAKAAEAKGGKPLAWIGALPVQYLYMRSFFSQGIPGDVFPAVNYFRKKAQQSWVQRNKYQQAMIALALFRTGDVQTAKDILASLRQNAIHDEEKGMYWKGMEGGYFWYEAPVETQSLLIEAFHEISGDAGIDRQLKTWLLRQKQTHHWPTTTATANACYALLIGGQDWLNAERSIAVTLGDKKIEWPSEPGVGYYKKIFDGPFVNPSMGNIAVTMKTRGGGGSPAWGAVYWQYFDMLDRITPTGGPKPALSITKKLFIQRNSERGPVLDTLADNATLRSGDRVVVRMIVRTDRDLEFVHIKDMRAACFEPEKVLSGYNWQDGLGYYETTKDASTDLFFSRLPRGTHVFEYTLFAGQVGNFSNGVTTIECMYAPEFSYHSEGIRVNVEAAP